MTPSSYEDIAKCTDLGSCKKKIRKIKTSTPRKKTPNKPYTYNPPPKKYEEKMAISISETVAGEGTTKYYEGKDTPEARKTATKYSFTKGNKNIK